MRRYPLNIAIAAALAAAMPVTVAPGPNVTAIQRAANSSNQPFQSANVQVATRAQAFTINLLHGYLDGSFQRTQFYLCRASVAIATDGLADGDRTEHTNDESNH